MSRTLSDLRDEINALIKSQGEDAPVAAFVFTQKDVFYMDEEQKPQFLQIEDTKKILKSLDENVYIYEQANLYITEEVFFKKSS